MDYDLEQPSPLKSVPSVATGGTIPIPKSKGEQIADEMYIYGLNGEGFKRKLAARIDKAISDAVQEVTGREVIGCD